jgi:hypothetical protein
VVVAEELNFGRPAARLRIAGPSLSQQIKALERDLGTRLFDRDRRTVTLTPLARRCSPRTRRYWSRPTNCAAQPPACPRAKPSASATSDGGPPDLTSRATGVAHLLVGTSVLPSHTQAARVADEASTWPSAGSAPGTSTPMA